MSWVRIRCHFRCSSCLRTSPLNQLDFDGTVECLRCGAEEAFDIGQWVDALEHARRVAESGSSEESSHGNDDIQPYALKRRTLVTRAACGQPACPGCAAPLRVERAMAGLLAVGCSSCDWTGKFLVPRGVRQSVPALSGVIAAAHAKDAQEATVEAGASGAAVVRCPYCTAPIEHAARATVARCTYCRVTVRMPNRALRESGSELEPEIWWLWFSPS
jgi:hypothetical protein